MENNRRRYQRFPYYESVSLQRAQDFPLEGSLSEDISLSGLKLNISEFIPINTILEVKIHIPTRASLVTVPAKVVWVRESPKCTDGWQIGIELIENQSSLLEIENLTRYLKLKSF